MTKRTCDAVTDHWRRVRDMRQAYGQAVNDIPTVPGREDLLAAVKLVVEETFELAEACGVIISMKERKRGDEYRSGVEFGDLEFETLHAPDLAQIGKEAADVSVTNTGLLALCGIQDKPLLEEVDANNFFKLQRGKIDPESGKFKKAADHPKPDIKRILRQQGWTNGST